MLLRALAKLMVYYGTKGRYEEAIAYGQRILSLDPLREEVHRELMRYHQLAGRRAGALRQFELCRRVLREELDIEPMPETIALYRRIRDSRWDTEEGQGLTQRKSPLISQMGHALAQLRIALEGFDDAKRQLSLAITAIEKLLTSYPR
jgi:DNA-binding SARP family transcriptional activator